MTGRITGRREAMDRLTQREVEVLVLASKGNSNKLIGKQLKISGDTAKNHMSSAMAKLGARDRTHAVVLAMATGELSVEFLAKQLVTLNKAQVLIKQAIEVLRG